MALIGFIITCLLLVGLFVYYKATTNKSASGHRVVVNDPSAQASYDHAKHGDEVKKLSLKEKIELSWQFLYEITEIVLNKFTKEDQKEINRLGHTLADNGAKYKHAVDSGVRQALSKTQGINIEQEKKAGQTRGV